MEDYLAVVALDFGTSYSGYVFQTRQDFRTDPQRIHAPNWYYESSQLVTSKTTTAILFSPSKEFHSFGYEAERFFSNLFVDDDDNTKQSLPYSRDPTKWYFFRHFKMQLYSDEFQRKLIEMNVSERMKLRDLSGKTMKALTVFSAAIKYLKQAALNEFENALDGLITAKDMKWVLTVPAIWGDRAKQFMRRAAQEADIPDDNLSLALEPEVAAFFCKEHLQNLQNEMDGVKSLKLRPFDEGSSFLVLDCGGGTVDITAFEIRDGHMKEILQASGGDWGGEKVDEQFMEIWEEILGKETLLEMKSKYPKEILEFHTSFQLLKRQLNKAQNEYAILLPWCVTETLGKPGTISDKFKIKYNRGKAIFPCDLLTRLFQAQSGMIVEHVKHQLEDEGATNVTDILMVGGFAESHVLFSTLKENFPNYRLLRPKECSLAVLKGAVTYGFNPDSIRQRISRFSYGFSSSKQFDPATDEEFQNHVLHNGSEKRLEDVFKTVVKIGDKLVPGKTVELDCRSVTPSAHTSLDIYRSASKQVPKFVWGEEHNCEKLGEVCIQNPGAWMCNRHYKVSFCFGYTELKVKVIDEEIGQPVEMQFNLLK